MNPLLSDKTLLDDRKPHAPAAECNKQPILEALQHELSENDLVLELGSGTGQNFCHFATNLPEVLWQPSDLTDKLTGIRQWMAESGCLNILPPLELDLRATQHPEMDVSVCYSANTLHIVSWTLVEQLFRHSAMLLAPVAGVASTGNCWHNYLIGAFSSVALPWTTK